MVLFAACAETIPGLPAGDAAADAQEVAADVSADIHDGNCRLQLCPSDFECVYDCGPLVCDSDSYICRYLPPTCVIPPVTSCVQDAFGRCDCPPCARILCPTSACHVVPTRRARLRVECGP